MPIDSGDVVPEKIANPQHTPHPNEGAQHVVREEFAEFHAPDPGDHGRKRPEDGDELGYHDCRAPISFLKFVRSDSMLLVEEEAVFALEDPRSGGAPNEITERIAQDCCEREHWSQLIYIQISTRREQAGGNKQGITG
jgi:hypothetical protein